MITWRARTYKPCEAILLAAYMTDRDKSGTRRSPDPKRAGCSRHRGAGPSTAPGASGDDATRHAHDGTTTRPNSRQRQHDPDDLPGRSQTRTVVPGRAGNDHGTSIKHVLLISVDGMHQQDLAWYVKNNPHSLLASLVNHGLGYTTSETPFPSDSSPGMYGQVTGGDPRVNGSEYDDTFNHDVFPAGTTNCTGPVPGAEAAYHEAIHVNPNSLDSAPRLSG